MTSPDFKNQSFLIESASGKDIHLIFWLGLIVFNPKMTIFRQFNREIKK